MSDLGLLAIFCRNEINSRYGVLAALAACLAVSVPHSQELL